MNFDLNDPTERPEPGLDPYVSDFIDEREKDLKEIGELKTEDDFKKLSQLTHKWVGFSRPYGFGRLEKLSREIHSAIPGRSLNKIESLLDEIRSYLSEKKKSLD